MAELLADDQIVEPSPLPGRRAAPVSSADVSRFVRDPHAFAASVGVESTEAFVSAYLKGLEKRLNGTVGAPKAAHRLATLAPEDLLVGDRVDDGELERMPRMGPVIVAAAVVTAVSSVVTAASAAYTAYTLFTTKRSS